MSGCCQVESPLRTPSLILIRDAHPTTKFVLQFSDCSPFLMLANKTKTDIRVVGLKRGLIEVFLLLCLFGLHLRWKRDAYQYCIINSSPGPDCGLYLRLTWVIFTGNIFPSAYRNYISRRLSSFSWYDLNNVHLHLCSNVINPVKILSSFSSVWKKQVILTI